MVVLPIGVVLLLSPVLVVVVPLLVPAAVVTAVVLVDHRVPPATRYEVAVDREGRKEGNG